MVINCLISTWETWPIWLRGLIIGYSICVAFTYILFNPRCDHPECHSEVFFKIALIWPIGIPLRVYKEHKED